VTFVLSLMLALIMCGSRCCSHNDFGAGKSYSVNDAARLLHELLLQEFLEEYGVQSTNSQFPTDMMYLKLGSRVGVSNAAHEGTCWQVDQLQHN
jgi:hypothetical protein